MSQDEMSQNRAWGHVGKSSAFLFIMYTGALIFGIGIAVMLENEDKGLPFFIIGLILLFIAGIYYLVLFYQVWRFVINGLRSQGIEPSIKSPGRAIGFLFIPIYSLYWVFKAYGNFAEDYNELSKAVRSKCTMGEGLGGIIPVLVILGIFPYVNLIAGTLNGLVLTPIFISIAVRKCKELGHLSAG